MVARLLIPMKSTLIALLFAGTIGMAAGPSPQSPASPPTLDPDLCIYGGTPAGVACAVRAAREGLSVLLVNRHDHLGGLLTSGIGVWDTLFEGKRSPIYD